MSLGRRSLRVVLGDDFRITDLALSSQLFNFPREYGSVSRPDLNYVTKTSPEPQVALLVRGVEVVGQVEVTILDAFGRHDPRHAFRMTTRGRLIGQLYSLIIDGFDIVVEMEEEPHKARKS